MNDTATPLDPIYAITENQRSHPKTRRKHSEFFNRWRATLPRYCYCDCGAFNECTPDRKCPRNPLMNK